MSELQVFMLLGVAVAVYALSAGADFGGGVWDLLASGPRRERQRELIAEAIAPIWEVNHIWMIFVVVLLFTVFPIAFAIVTTALHIPMLLALVGIVLRGSAFVFRAYGMQPTETRARWGRVFAITSALTPIFLGMILAALSSGEIRVDMQTETLSSGFFAGWLSPFALATGVFALVLFALLAAVYLAREAELRGELELRDDFRLRALVCEAVAFVLAIAVLALAHGQSQQLFAGLLGAPWSIPIQVLTFIAASGAIVCLWKQRMAMARTFVMFQVGLVVLGWGAAMDRHLVLPDVHVTAAGAVEPVLAFLPWVLLGDSVLLVPALWWLFRVFRKLE